MRNAIGDTRILGAVLLVLATAAPVRAGIISVDMPASASPGEQITVGINMSGMPGPPWYVSGFNFQIKWDAAVLDYVSSSLGSIIPPASSWTYSETPVPSGDQLTVGAYGINDADLLDETEGNIFSLVFDVMSPLSNGVTTVTFSPFDSYNLTSIDWLNLVTYDIDGENTGPGGGLTLANDSMQILNDDPAVPEPSSLMVCLLGVAAFSTVKRFRSRRQRRAEAA